MTFIYASILVCSKTWAKTYTQKEQQLKSQSENILFFLEEQSSWTFAWSEAIWFKTITSSVPVKATAKLFPLIFGPWCCFIPKDFSKFCTLQLQKLIVHSDLVSICSQYVSSHIYLRTLAFSPQAEGKTPTLTKKNFDLYTKTSPNKQCDLLKW